MPVVASKVVQQDPMRGTWVLSVAQGIVRPQGAPRSALPVGAPFVAAAEQIPATVLVL